MHHAIAALERAGKVVAVVTQNVDGLHRRAGTSPHLLVELHGTDFLVECQGCHAMSEPAPHFARFKMNRRPPECACGVALKSATISFGQQLRTTDLERATAAAMKSDRRIGARINPVGQSGGLDSVARGGAGHSLHHRQPRRDRARSPSLGDTPFGGRRDGHRPARR